MRRRTPVTLVVASFVLLGACTSTSDDVVDFGDAAPAEDAPEVPADAGLHVSDAPAPADEPPSDARLEPGGWPEAAALIAREAEGGRPTLVNLFASWCGPCRTEMPLLVQAWHDNPDIAFLGIDHLDRLADGEAFVEEFDVDFPTIHDLEGDVAAAIGARGMPTTVVFDREGRMAARVFGEVTETALEQLLDEIR